jgi:hypothetical protein
MCRNAKQKRDGEAQGGHLSDSCEVRYLSLRRKSTFSVTSCFGWSGLGGYCWWFVTSCHSWRQRSCSPYVTRCRLSRFSLVRSGASCRPYKPSPAERWLRYYTRATSMRHASAWQPRCCNEFHGHCIFTRWPGKLCEQDLVGRAHVTYTL